MSTGWVTGFFSAEGLDSHAGNRADTEPKEGAIELPRESVRLMRQRLFFLILIAWYSITKCSLKLYMHLHMLSISFTGNPKCIWLKCIWKFYNTIDRCLLLKTILMFVRGGGKHLGLPKLSLFWFDFGFETGVDDSSQAGLEFAM